MLTKNFFSWTMANLTGKDIVNGYVFPDGTVGNATRQTNKPYYLWEYMNYLSISDIPSSYLFIGTRIGTGATPATADDYTMESVITSGLITAESNTVTVTKENGFVAVYATYTVTNTGTTAVAISEIGLFGATNGSSSGTKPILMDRTVLESPIVINPGEAKPLTYTIRFNYPVE